MNAGGEWLPRLLDGTAMRRWLTNMSPADLDDALMYVDLLERADRMDHAEAAGWRWRLLASWAERELQSRRAAQQVAVGAQ